MTNCKHNNDPAACQQCQYQKDADRYPWPEKLWEYYYMGAWIPCGCNPILKFNHRRRPDADEIIAEFEKEQRKENYKPVSVLRDEWLAKQEDKCSTCRHSYEPKEG